MGYLSFKYKEGIVNRFVWACVLSCLPVVLAPSIFSLSARTGMAFATRFVFISMRKKDLFTRKMPRFTANVGIQQKQNASLSPHLFFA